MHESDANRFRDVIRGLGKVFGSEADAVLLDAYWLALRDWPFEEFERAAKQLLLTSKFMPRPADFHELRKAALPTAGEAWAKVLQHLKGGYRFGAGLTPEIEGTGLTPQIDRVVASIGGYRALAMMDIDQLPWMERRFAEHYRELADVSERRGEPLPQVGWSNGILPVTVAGQGLRRLIGDGHE